jgi:hypothetical protein
MVWKHLKKLSEAPGIFKEISPEFRPRVLLHAGFGSACPASNRLSGRGILLPAFRGAHERRFEIRPLRPGFQHAQSLDFNCFGFDYFLMSVYEKKKIGAGA